VNIDDILLLFLGSLLAIVLLTSIAIRLHVPYPIILVIGGCLPSFIPIPQNDLQLDLRAQELKR
jgi:hypothetical protein